MELYNGCSGAVIQTADTKASARWICENLFFREVRTAHHTGGRVLRNGNCTLYLIKGEARPEQKMPEDSYGTGLAHIALHAADINKAITWCKMQNLSLELEGNESFCNPQVFEKGERFFNIQSPFGVIFEVSEQIKNPVKTERHPIVGLDHLGIPCYDIEEELQFLKGLGYRPLFDVVLNYNEKEGNISCVMVSDEKLILEVYQFMDRKARPIPEGGSLAGIAHAGMTADSPAGVHFIGTEARV